jgi:V-type H+-transporting ATPase subunit a
LAIAAICMCLFEGRLEQQRRRGDMNEILQMVFGGRYILLMMSIFAIYVGSVYNDAFSVSPNAFGSSFTSTSASTAGGDSLILSGVRPYPFG